MTEPVPAKRTSGARAVARDFWRTFFADPVRENVIRARGGGPAGATMVALGLAAFALAAVGVVIADRLAALPIGTGSATLGNATTPGSPVGIPVVAYPALICLLLISTASGLFGAVYAKPTLATMAVAMLTLPSILLAGSAWRFREVGPSGWLALPAVLAMAPTVLALRRRRARPPTAMVVTSALAVAGVGGSAFAQIAAYTRPGTSGGLPLFGAGLEQILSMLGLLVAPMAILAGAGAVSFGRTATAFLARTVERLAPGSARVLPALTALALVVALALTVRDVVGAESPPRWLVRLTVAAALVVIAAEWWRWAGRAQVLDADAVEAGASTGAPTVALVLAAFAAPLTLALVAANVVSSVLGGPRLVGPATALAEAMGHSWTGAVYAACAGTIFLAAAFAVVRTRPSLAAGWLGLAGAVLLVLIGWNQIFSGPQWGGFVITDVARAATVLLALGAGRAVLRARSLAAALGGMDVRDAFAVIVLLALVIQGGFVGDPFAAVLGFAGIGLVFFGVVWGFLTSGAHSSVTGLPGLGRTAVLIAYAVLSTTLLAWGLATGADGASSLSGDFGQVGSNVLGTTLLLALLAATRHGADRQRLHLQPLASAPPGGPPGGP